MRIGKIQKWIELGRLDPNKPITVRELVSSRCVGTPLKGIYLNEEVNDIIIFNLLLFIWNDL